MDIRTDLPEPNIELVENKIEQFNHDNENLERGLAQLIEAFPKNSDLGHVLVKVAAINTLYTTRIFAVLKVAQLIQSCEIDPLLESGSVGAVKAIEKVDLGKRSVSIYSFATKYCSWHQPERYPIYDSRVDFCLRSYRDQFKFYEFDYYDLRNYEKLLEVMNAFRQRFQLQAFGYKEIDKFLYQLGNEYFNSAESGLGTGDPKSAVVPDLVKP